MASNLLTDLGVKAGLRDSAKNGAEKWLPDSDGRGSGRLLLRCKAGVGHWYFRYTKPDGSRDTLPIGPLALGRNIQGEGSGAAYTLPQVREKALQLATLLKSPETANIRATFEGREHARQAAQVAEAAAQHATHQARERRQRYTLGALLGLYCQHLANGGKASAGTVQSALDLHLLRNNPALCAKPANEVKRADIAQLVRGLSEGGKVRTAGLLRAYLHAAYRLAQTAEGDPQAPSALIAFAIEHNPVEGVKALPVARRERVLAEDELRALLLRLNAEGSIIAALLRMSLYAGGQRPLQMARTTVQDFNASDGTLLLHDGKGKRTQARPHLLPLGAMALVEVQALAQRAQQLGTQHLFTHDGKQPVQIASMGRWVRELCNSLEAASAIRSPFQAKDLRRTAETMLAKLGISSDLRAQVLSHGLSGIQAARYDRHDYLSEKRTVLATWEAHLQTLLDGRIRRNVVPLQRQA